MADRKRGRERNPRQAHYTKITKNGNHYECEQTLRVITPIKTGGYKHLDTEFDDKKSEIQIQKQGIQCDDYDYDIGQWIKAQEMVNVICQRNLELMRPKKELKREDLKWIMAELPNDLAELVNDYEATSVLWRIDELWRCNWKILLSKLRVDFAGDWKVGVRMYYYLVRPKPRGKSIFSEHSIQLLRKIKIPPDTVVVAYGQSSVAVLDSSGQLFEKCGDDKKFKNITAPTNIEQIACGYADYATLMSQLAEGSLLTTVREYGNSAYPQAIKNIVIHIPLSIDVACGKYHQVILTKDRNLMVRGNNHYGQLGFRATMFFAEFTQVNNIPNDITDVACGENTTMIRRAKGVIMACGDYTEINKYSVWKFGENQYAFVEICMPERLVDYIFQ